MLGKIVLPRHTRKTKILHDSCIAFGGYKAMPLGSIVRLWGAIDYEPDLRFFDKMFSVASSLRKEFEHWWTDRLSIVLHDYSRRESLTMSNKRISFEAANSDDLSKTVSTLAGYVRRCLDELGYHLAKRMGLKLVVFADLDLTFENIREQIRPLCLPHNDALEKITSAEITDLALNFDYTWTDKKVMVRVGPMNKEQGLKTLLKVGDLARLFPPPDQSDEFSDFCSSVPDSFLYFDIDVYLEGESGVNKWPTFVHDVQPYSQLVFEGIKRLILECEPC